MIELSILKQLQDAGFGTIDTDLFLEEVPIDSKGVAKDGVWIVTRGSSVSRIDTEIQAFDIYSRYKNKITGSVKLHAILEYLKDAFAEVCTLPAVAPYTTQTYKNVRIRPVSSVESLGTDENGKIVRVISGEVQYFKGE